MLRAESKSRAVLVAGVLALLASRARAEDSASRESERSWRWIPSVLLYLLADDSVYLQPTIAVDRERLHLEGRYNNENRETASAFGGWTFSFGAENGWSLELTPMIGGVAGRTSGIAPALTISAGWGRFALWSQSELVVDLGALSASFFYAWTELSASLGEEFRIGAALQRTRVLRQPRTVEWGPFVGFTFGKVQASLYLFAPGTKHSYGVVGVSARF